MLVSVALGLKLNRASDINPNDIESIDILKYAAAAALYGSRAQTVLFSLLHKALNPGKPKVTLRCFLHFLTTSPQFNRTAQITDKVVLVLQVSLLHSPGGPAAAPGTPTFNHERGYVPNRALLLTTTLQYRVVTNRTTYYLSAWTNLGLMEQ